MPATRSRTGSQTITVATPVNSEAFHATVWRGLVDAWPSWSAPPIASFHDGDGDDGSDMPSTALLLDVREGLTPESVRALDAARRRSIPVVALADDPDQRRALDDGPEVIAIASDASPVETACVLATLIRRQRTVGALHNELGTMQKFHTGVRGEIDKMNEEMQLAATMQREFLPACLPGIPGYDAAALYRPCGCVSGDIYDVRALGDGRAILMIADAVGHGVPAALMTMVIAKSVSHTIQLFADGAHEVDPAFVLGELNKDLAGRGLDASRFATAVCGLLDTRDHTLSLASAGHPHPLLIGADGVIERVPCEGCLLGVFEEAEYESATVKMRRGDALLLYSDGFEVAFPTTDPDGSRGSLPNTHYLDRFSAIPARAGESSLHEALLTLSAELDAHRGSLHQQDDLTVVGIVRTDDA